MSTLFLAKEILGANYDATRQRREQEARDEHIAFMSSLVDDGVVILAGPVDSTQDLIFLVNAADPEAVRQHLEADPWHVRDIVRLSEVQRWDIWLDGRDDQRSAGPR